MKEEKGKINNKVFISIEEEPYIMMMIYAHEFSPNECSGTGLAEKTVDRNGDVQFNITEVFLPKQRNTPVTTDIESDEANKINTQLVIDGKNTSHHILHWHSHVDMSVFESGTDHDNYDDMQTGKFSISVVVNKRYEIYGSVHLYDPLRIDVENIEIEVPEIDLDNYEVPKKLRKIIMKNVETVQAWEKENKRAPIVQPVKTYSTPDYGYSGFGYAVEIEPILRQLLIQAEKAGMLTLEYDAYNNISGYTTPEGETYDITTDKSYDWGKYNDSQQQFLYD
jgi:hypothetical protein